MPRKRLATRKGPCGSPPEWPGLSRRTNAKPSNTLTWQSASCRRAVTTSGHSDAALRARLMDTAAPLLRGEQAVQQIRAIRPDVPVLVASGDSEMATRER